MIQRAALPLAAVLSASLAAAFALAFRLPLPVPGFAALAAAALAGAGTLALLAWLPAGWVWTEDERLRLAFRARHGITDAAAASALEAITQTHGRATRLRRAARAMRDDMAARVDALADRLDLAAREIFYLPRRHQALRTVLSRSALIEEAARAHAALRRRKGEAATEDASRERLAAALGAIEEALDRTELSAARGLLHEVDVASGVAEDLLRPGGAGRRAVTARP